MILGLLIPTMEFHVWLTYGFLLLAIICTWLHAPVLGKIRIWQICLLMAMVFGYARNDFLEGNWPGGQPISNKR